MIINYSKQSIKFLKRQDRSTKERIVDAINKLPKGDVVKYQGSISKYRLRVGVKEVEPDSVDLVMLNEIETNPDCRAFISNDEAMKELGLQ